MRSRAACTCVEREGFSASQAADFVLVGSMNPEEGTLRPQLLDRFALAVDVEAPTDIELRCQVLERRLAFNRDPEAFCADWAAAQLSVAGKLASARGRLTSVRLHREVLQYVATRVAEHDVRSLRADLAAVRASRAHAALDGIGCRQRGARRGGTSAGAGPPHTCDTTAAHTSTFA